MAPRLFTLEEALALLPIVRRLLQEARDLKREMEERGRELERLTQASSGNGHLTSRVAAARRELESAVARLQARLEEIERLGVEVKGIDEGLVDFRSLREGRVVYLCYRLGEETIAYWHELESGFAGRQPL